jgi:hypothetical protein
MDIARPVAMSDKKYTSIQHENAAGRVEFKGGKAVWEWSQDSSGSTSILLKSLDNPELALEKTQKTPIPKGVEAKTHGKVVAPQEERIAQRVDPDEFPLPRGGRGGGFDPYNRS